MLEFSKQQSICKHILLKRSNTKNIEYDFFAFILMASQSQN